MRPHKIPVQLIQIAKSILFSDGAVLELLKALSRSRFDIHEATINDAIPVAHDPINTDSILFSRYFMSRRLGERDR